MARNASQHYPENTIRNDVFDADGKFLYTRIDGATDASTNAVTTIDYEQHEVHGGSHFAYKSAQDLTNGQTISFIVTAPNTTKWAHFGFRLTAESEYDIQMFEDATPDNVGTTPSAPAVGNSNRNSATAPTTLITHTPTLGGGSKGTLIRRWHGGSASKLGGDAGTGSKIILKQNTKYWFDVTNATAVNNFVSWEAAWYEHTNK